MREGEACGAVALHLSTGESVAIAAKTIVIATGGLTRLYRRNSASLNMGGDGYALALRAGAELIDMEFVQFFPIGHLAPRMIGMDPIMWDPFRYKLGGRLLNAEMRGIRADRYGEAAATASYVLTRDVATYAIFKEVEAGRGSPGRRRLSQLPACAGAELREAFGPVIDRLAENGIDLPDMPVEVAPIAHYHMGGIARERRAGDARRRTFSPAARRSAAPTAPTAFRAMPSPRPSCSASAPASRRARAPSARRMPAPRRRRRRASIFCASAEQRDAPIPPPCWSRLQALMADNVGPFRTEEKLAHRAARLARNAAGSRRPPPASPRAASIMVLLDWLDLRNMLLVAQAVVLPALARNESRGAHQREDFPGLLTDWAAQSARRADGRRIALRLEAQRTRRSQHESLARHSRAAQPDAGAARGDASRSPFEPGQSVLDGLRWFARDQDPSLAFRFSCINANACKECMMLIDGEVGIRLHRAAEGGTCTLAPLPNKALIRDLVTEIAPPDERLLLRL